MRLRRVRPLELITGACGVALLVALFVPWFEAADAWEAFSVLDLLLAAVAAAAVALPVIAAANAKTDAPIAATALTALGGIVASLLVLYRLLEPVGDGSRCIGLYLGIAASLGIAIAAWRAMADERTG
jgi:RsiW-degrading membrane proteinase PrsW (M82 family)